MKFLSILYKVAFVLLLFFFIFISYYYLNCQTEEKYSYVVLIDRISVNGKIIDSSKYSNIVLSTNDSITIEYHCDVSGAEKTPFVFRVVLNYENQTSVQPTNKTAARFVNLSENNYELIIEAFGNEWKAVPAELKFRVNNRETGLLKEINSLNNALSKKSISLKKSSTKSKMLFGMDIISLIIGVIAGTAFICLITFIVLFNIKKTQNPKLHKGVNMKTQKTEISKEQYDKVLAEKSNLKAEIAALRGQIDAMQARGTELNKRNRELEEKIERLSKSKSELEDLQTQKDDLFAVIIHDIKNPVALIKSLVELLRSYDLTATEQQEVIDDIFITTTKIVSLSQEVSKIIALESSSLELNIDKIDINEILTESFKRNKIAADNKSISVTLDLVENLPLIEIDAQKIDDVVDNLISNAFKFTHKGGKVRITASVQSGNMVVEISDNGLGLSEDDVKKAFQRGSRLSARPTDQEHSSGLGLWIVKKLIEAHKGRVWVKSALGKGSTFAFSIPLKAKNQ